MNTADFIRARRKDLKMTQEELASKCGVNRVAVTLWESKQSNGNTPNGDNLLKLAKALHVSPDIILDPSRVTLEDIAELPSVEDQLGEIEPWDSKTPLDTDDIEIPFFKEVAIAAGNGSVVEKEVSGMKLRFAKSTLRRYNVDPSCAVCATVHGTSMEPVLPDGSTVGINTANTVAKDGKMFAIDHDGMLRIKILHRLPGGGLRLRSYNRDEYPDEDYSQYDAQKIRILGAVFWCSFMIEQ